MTFRTCYSHFKYVVMLFGLKLTNAPVVFQQLMNDVFHEYLDDFVVCYTDDIIIFSTNMGVHEHHVRLVLEKLQESNFMQVGKCEFHQFKVEFLGYAICMDRHKVQTIVELITPTSI